MTQETESVEVRPEPPPLKVAEQPVNADAPWVDDVLDRKEIADRLTSIVRDQEAPFVISVDGRWGTGKTFLLKRWAQDLRNQDPKWQAIYDNAWEDDFASDPLLAIIAQFSQHVGTGFKERAGKLVEVAGPLLSYGVSLAALFGAGIPVPPVPTGTASPAEKLDAYMEKQVAKNELRVLLRELAAEVRQETGQPLVFIIDELDRCRPTFAIELLERVKHIFDVPNIVFVFGINRSELVKSLKSVYGDIDAGVYLQRFFDMPFVLPEPDGHLFCRHLALQFGLSAYLQQLSVSGDGPVWLRDVPAIDEQLPNVLGNMGLSLRDLDYCVRLISLAMRDFAGGHPLLFLLLVALKIKEPDLYQRFVEKRARAAEVIDFLNNETPLGTRGGLHLSIDPRDLLHRVQAAVYCADAATTVQEQLQTLMQGGEPERPEYLSRQHAQLGSDHAEFLRDMRDLIQRCVDDPYRPSVGLWSMAQTIDLYYRTTRLPGT